MEYVGILFLSDLVLNRSGIEILRQLMHASRLWVLPAYEYIYIERSTWDLLAFFDAAIEAQKRIQYCRYLQMRAGSTCKSYARTVQWRKSKGRPVASSRSVTAWCHPSRPWSSPGPRWRCDADADAERYMYRIQRAGSARAAKNKKWLIYRVFDFPMRKVRLNARRGGVLGRTTDIQSLIAAGPSRAGRVTRVIPAAYVVQPVHWSPDDPHLQSKAHRWKTLQFWRGRQCPNLQQSAQPVQGFYARATMVPSTPSWVKSPLLASIEHPPPHPPAPTPAHCPSRAVASLDTHCCERYSLAIVVIIAVPLEKHDQPCATIEACSSATIATSSTTNNTNEQSIRRATKLLSPP